VLKPKSSFHSETGRDLMDTAIKPKRRSSEQGFTVVEVMIAGVILTVGLLALAYAYGQGLGLVSSGQQDEIARQQARETMEDVLMARNTDNLTWEQINNVSNGGIFLDGPQPLTTPSAASNGLVGTADDGPVATIVVPGADGQLGTSDDITVTLSNYQRTILIASLSQALKQITITITYVTASGVTRNYQLVCYVSPYI
jgi:Tfp pilus assembly protein PilV